MGKEEQDLSISFRWETYSGTKNVQTVSSF